MSDHDFKAQGDQVQAAPAHDNGDHAAGGGGHAAQGPAAGAAGNPVLAQVPPVDTSKVQGTLSFLVDVLAGNGLRGVKDADPRFLTPVLKINMAKTDHTRAATERLQLLDDSMRELQPLFSAYDLGSYLSDNILEPVRSFREELQKSTAQETVKSRLDAADKDEHLGFQTKQEEADEKKRHELLDATEALITAGETASGTRDAALQAMGAKAGGEFDEAFMAKLEGTMNVLKTVKGVLWISDPKEALKEVREADFGSWSGAMKGVAAYAELLSSTASLLDGASHLLVSGFKMVAKLANSTELVEKLGQVGEKLGKIGVIVDVLDVVKDVAVIADGSKPTEERVDAGIDAGTTAISKIGAPGFIVGTTLKLTWAGIKAIGDAYAELKEGFLGGVDHGLATLAENGSNLAYDLRRLGNAGMQLDSEKDPSIKKAYEEQIKQEVEVVGHERNFILELAQPAGLQAGDYHPGQWAVISGAFAPLQHFHGQTDPTDGASDVLAQVKWCLDNAGQVREQEGNVYAQAGHDGL